MRDLEKWQFLVMGWLKANATLKEEMAELDAQVMVYLENKGARPGQKLLKNIEACCHQEIEARGMMDHFIAELH